MPLLRGVILFLFTCFALTSCYPPGIQYPATKLVTARRATLYDNLLKLLPENQQQLRKAQEEAKWLADTSYKASAGIARINNSHFPGWAGNALVNSYIQDRGLCWHYQHDMYRELRRRPLEYFRLGCCVRDKSKRTEHNCLYIAAIQDAWPRAWVLDAWMWNGRLKVDYGPKMDQKRWADLPSVTEMLAAYYKEGHSNPVEHWLVLRGSDGKYGFSTSKQVENSSQLSRMNENIKKGLREHPGSPVNY